MERAIEPMCNAFELISRLAQEGVPLDALERAFAGCLSKRTVREYYRRARLGARPRIERPEPPPTQPSTQPPLPLVENAWVRILRGRGNA